MRVLGAYGNQLLDWLQNWIFPEELKYSDRDYAREAAGQFFDALLAGGTTTCQAFTTSNPVSTEEFFDEAARRNMRVIAGLTGIDRFAPDDTVITPGRLLPRDQAADRALPPQGPEPLRDHARGSPSAAPTR